MALMSRVCPAQLLESWIGSALDIIVHQTKQSGGARVVSEVALVGLSEGQVQVAQVYAQERGVSVDGLPEWFQKKIGPEKSGRVSHALLGEAAR